MTSLQIQQLLDQYHVPPHIRRHCEQVAKVAQFLGKKLAEKGERIDLQPLHEACLLHDMLRVCDMQTYDPWQFPTPPTVEDLETWDELRQKYHGQNHALVAEEILKSKRELKIANLIRKHDFWFILDDQDKPKTWEEKLIYYADKRVEQDQIVSLDERLHKGHIRNKPADMDTVREKKVALVHQAIYDLEKEIFTKIGLSPRVVNELK